MKWEKVKEEQREGREKLNCGLIIFPHVHGQTLPLRNILRVKTPFYPSPRKEVLLWIQTLHLLLCIMRRSSDRSHTAAPSF